MKKALSLRLWKSILRSARVKRSTWKAEKKICSCLPAPRCSIHIAAERTLRVNTRRFETKSKKFFIPCPHGLVDFFTLSNGVPWPRSSFKKLMNFIFWNFLGWHFRLIFLCLENFLVFQNLEVFQHSDRGDHL